MIICYSVIYDTKHTYNYKEWGEDDVTIVFTAANYAR